MELDGISYKNNKKDEAIMHEFNYNPTILPCGCKRKAVVVSSNYIALSDDRYIGVDSNKSVIITLPDSPEECDEIIVKAEMSPPIGNRKITIITSDGSTIDGYSSHIIHVSHERVHLLYRGGNWRII